MHTTSLDHTASLSGASNVRSGPASGRVRVRVWTCGPARLSRHTRTRALQTSPMGTRADGCVVWARGRCHGGTLEGPCGWGFCRPRFAQVHAFFHAPHTHTSPRLPTYKCDPDQPWQSGLHRLGVHMTTLTHCRSGRKSMDESTFRGGLVIFPLRVRFLDIQLDGLSC